MPLACQVFFWRLLCIRTLTTCVCVHKPKQLLINFIHDSFLLISCFQLCWVDTCICFHVLKLKFTVWFYWMWRFTVLGNLSQNSKKKMSSDKISIFIHKWPADSLTISEKNCLTQIYRKHLKFWELSYILNITFFSKYWTFLIPNLWVNFLKLYFAF